MENVVIPLLFGLVTLGLYTPYFWLRDSSPRHGKLHLGVTCFGLLCVSIVAPGSVIIILTWACLSAIAVVSGMIAAPLQMRATQERATEEHGDDIRWAADLQTTIESLRSSFDDINRRLSDERVGLEATWTKMQREFELQDKRVAQAEREFKRARSEAERYKTLANISKSEQRAILDLIYSRKKREYWVGVLWGATPAALFEGVRFILSLMTR